MFEVLILNWNSKFFRNAKIECKLNFKYNSLHASCGKFCKPLTPHRFTFVYTSWTNLCSSTLDCTTANLQLLKLIQECALPDQYFGIYLRVLALNGFDSDSLPTYFWSRNHNWKLKISFQKKETLIYKTLHSAENFRIGYH